MKKEENNFLLFIGLSFLTVLLSAFLLTILGIVDFRIVNEIKLNSIVECAFNFVMFIANLFFVFSITLRIFDKKIIRITLLYIPVWFVGTIIAGFINDPDYDLIFSTILPFLYVLFATKGRLNSKIVRFGVITLIVSAYQQISGYIKLLGFGAYYYNLNTVVYLLLSIDLFLFYTLLYCGVKRHVQIMESGKFSVFSEAKSIHENAEQGIDDLNLAELSNRQRFMFWCMATGYQIFQLAVVLLIGLINSVFIELLIMLAVFWIGRPILKKSWHSDSLMWCSITTFCGFYILTKTTLPLSVSLFSCIALSALFVYVLHRAAIHADTYEKLLEERQERDDFKNKSRRGRAKTVLQTLSPSHVDYEILAAYVNGETLEIIADTYNLSLSTLNRKINALTRK